MLVAKVKNVNTYIRRSAMAMLAMIVEMVTPGLGKMMTTNRTCNMIIIPGGLMDCAVLRSIMRQINQLVVRNFKLGGST